MNDRNIIVTTSGGKTIDNYFWFVSSYEKWLCKMNINDYVVEFVCVVPDGNGDAYSYIVAEGKENILYLIPQFADYFLEYNIDNNSFLKHELVHSLLDVEKNCGEAVKYREAQIIGNTLWILPMSSHCIIEYDIEKKQVFEHIDWFTCVNKKHRDKILFGTGTTSEEKIWLPSVQDNSIVEFNINNHKANIKYIGKRDDKFSACYYNDKENVLYITSYTNDILYKVDCNYNVQEVIQLGINQKDCNKDARDIEIWNVRKSGDELLILPSAGEKLVLFDIDNNCVNKIIDHKINDIFCFMCSLDEERLIISSPKAKRVYVFDALNSILNEVQTYFFLTYEKHPFVSTFDEKYISLSEVIKSISCKCDNNAQFNGETVGEEIYAKITKET